VEQVLQILKDEFKLAMMLSGRWFTLLAVLTKLFHNNFCLQVVHVWLTSNQRWWSMNPTTILNS